MSTSDFQKLGYTVETPQMQERAPYMPYNMPTNGPPPYNMSANVAANGPQPVNMLANAPPHNHNNQYRENVRLPSQDLEGFEQPTSGNSYGQYTNMHNNSMHNNTSSYQSTTNSPTEGVNNYGTIYAAPDVGMPHNSPHGSFHNYGTIYAAPGGMPPIGSPEDEELQGTQV
jgi:hypothetical protein